MELRSQAEKMEEPNYATAVQIIGELFLKDLFSLTDVPHSKMNGIRPSTGSGVRSPPAKIKVASSGVS